MRFRVKESERKPEPEPIESNAHIAVMLGTAAWLIALVAFLILDSAFPNTFPRWWLYTCIFGIALGIFGYFKVRRR